MATAMGRRTYTPAKGSSARHIRRAAVASSLDQPASSLTPAAVPTTYVASPSEVGMARRSSGPHPNAYDTSMPHAAYPPTASTALTGTPLGLRAVSHLGNAPSRARA